MRKKSFGKQKMMTAVDVQDDMVSMIAALERVQSRPTKEARLARVASLLDMKPGRVSGIYYRKTHPKPHEYMNTKTFFETVADRVERIRRESDELDRQAAELRGPMDCTDLRRTG